MRKILVTGGSRGIGKAIVERFAKDADTQIVFSYNKNSEIADKMVAESGGRLRAFQMDLLNPEQLKESIDQLMEEFGRFDVVVHNAAFCMDGPFYFMEEEQWQSVIQASLNSFFHINKRVLPAMIGERSGRIVVLASVSGEIGNRGQVNYSAAKGALIAASKALSKEVARKGVLVNIVSPGLIETDMSVDAPFDHIKSQIPIGRIGKASEVAGVVHFLASEDASYMSGALLKVNGGLST